MHPVEDGIGPGVQEGAALGDKKLRNRKILPEFVHLKHLMRCISMQKNVCEKSDRNQ